MTALKVALIELSDRVPGPSGDGSAVVHATLTDGREFSVLAATPDWFAKAFSEAGLSFYYGPSILFLKRLEKPLAKRAVEQMLTKGDRWLCLYDTPRTTLPKVLADFKARRGPTS